MSSEFAHVKVPHDSSKTSVWLKNEAGLQRYLFLFPSTKVPVEINMGVAQKGTSGVAQVFVVVPIYQGACGVPYFEPQPYLLLESFVVLKGIYHCWKHVHIFFEGHIRKWKKKDDFP